MTLVWVLVTQPRIQQWLETELWSTQLWQAPVTHDKLRKMYQIWHTCTRSFKF